MALYKTLRQVNKSLTFQVCRQFSSAEPLTIMTQENGIRQIKLNNPKKRNALSVDLMNSLKSNLTHEINDLDLRVIILSANGPVFCSGHDLKELTATTKKSDHAHIFSLCSSIMELIQDLPVPVICEVGSFATAAGCQLVATCDMAIASEKASFCTPGVNIGLFCSTPGVALGRAVPRKIAMDMLLTGDIIDAQTALKHGLVSRVVEHENLHAESLKIAKQITEKSRSVITLGKHAFYRQIVKDRSPAYQDASTVMVRNLSMHDGHHGISSFLKKEKPTWNHDLDEFER